MLQDCRHVAASAHAAHIRNSAFTMWRTLRRTATSVQSKVEKRPPHTAKLPPILGASRRMACAGAAARPRPAATTGPTPAARAGTEEDRHALQARRTSKPPRKRALLGELRTPLNRCHKPPPGAQPNESVHAWAKARCSRKLYVLAAHRLRPSRTPRLCRPALCRGRARARGRRRRTPSCCSLGQPAELTTPTLRGPPRSTGQCAALPLT